jgi:hypothetical protein
MHGRRTAGWYVTRLLLAIGIGTFLLVAVLLLLEPTFMGGTGRRMSDEPLVLAGLVAAGAGLVWMIRIFRGPRDEPPPWRYRAR